MPVPSTTGDPGTNLLDFSGMKPILPSTILRFVTVMALAGIIIEFATVTFRPMLARWFPPLYPHLVALLALSLLSVLWGGRGLWRRIVIGAALIAFVAVGFLAQLVYSVSDSRPQSICSSAYHRLPAGHNAREIGLPNDFFAQPEISFSWPGDFTCTWPSDGDIEGATYTWPIATMTSDIAANFS